MTTARNIFERFFWTFVAAGIGAIPIFSALTGNGSTIAWSAALTAGIAGVIALAKNYLLKPPAFSNNKTLNVIERLAWTAIQAFVGSLPATINLTGHDLKALAYSGGAAALAAVVSLAKNLTIQLDPPGFNTSPTTAWPGTPVAGQAGWPTPLAPLAPDAAGKLRPVPASSNATTTTQPSSGSAGPGVKFAKLASSEAPDQPTRAGTAPKKAARTKKSARQRPLSKP